MADGPTMHILNSFQPAGEVRTLADVKTVLCMYGEQVKKNPPNTVMGPGALTGLLQALTVLVAEVESVQATLASKVVPIGGKDPS